MTAKIKEKPGRISPARQYTYKSIRLIGAVHSAAAALDIAIAPSVVAKQRRFLIAPATAIECLGNDIAIIQISWTIMVPAITHISPTDRVKPGVVMEDAVK
ncbi:MAG: hypothetical protein DHS20C05_15000 [Hyphococcus sp.]|nr:MAG: hypothetical protein DHS20C05_15000 [Marinicaulis sp.]